MELPAIFYSLVPVEWWKSEMKDNLDQHKGPALVFGATTLLITVMGGKKLAVSFACTALLTYPFSHRQIVYLMYLDAHETVYAVAVVGIQIFCKQFPPLSAWGLPLSMALGYAISVRGMRIRWLTEQQKIEIQKNGELNKQLTSQVDIITTNATSLKEALTALKNKTRQKKETLVQRERLQQQKDETVIQVGADAKQLNTLLTELTETCKIAADDAGISKQLQKVDENQQKIAEQTEQISLKNKELEKIVSTLKESNQKLGTLIEKALKGEEAVRQELQQFQQWISSIQLAKL